MSKLAERSVRINREEDIVPEILERALQSIDDNFRRIDQRRIKQQTKLDMDASLENVIKTLNTLIDALNNSDFTED